MASFEPQPRRSPSRRALLVAAGSLLLLVIFGLLAQAFGGRAPGGPGEGGGAPSAAVPGQEAAGDGTTPAGGAPGRAGDEPGPRHFDLLVRGGLVIDGSGRPAFRADVGVVGDRIVAVGDLAGAAADEVIDAAGLVVAPGFINAHSHTYEYVAGAPEADADLMQGITTVIGGVDGRSPWPLGRFFTQLEEKGIGNNQALFVGHGTVRARVMGTADRPPSPRELERMGRLVRQAMEEGALGLSTGLEYVPGRYARTDELIALARHVAPYGGIYSSHMRSEGDDIGDALAEALRIGREAGVPVNISHFKVVFRRNWEKLAGLMAQIEAARQSGQVVVADVYPYLAPDYTSALRLRSVWPQYPPEDVFIRQSRVTAAVGSTLAEYAARLGVPAPEAARQLLARDRDTVATVFVVSEANLEQLLRAPFTIISNDGGARRPVPDPRTTGLHPRVYGAYPRVLARYVRERGVLTLEEAVHKMTGAPATFFGLRDRGFVREGMYADLVVFDPEHIQDVADWVRPQAYPRGIVAVVVNGQVAVRDGRRVPGVLAGRVLRGGKDALIGNPRTGAVPPAGDRPVTGPRQGGVIPAE
ncbi:MAG TPA: D-aminoacylase [Thermaerobacter sp.]